MTLDPRYWWCPHCLVEVPPEKVTYTEHHDDSSGGCGYKVMPYPEQPTSKTKLNLEQRRRIALKVDEVMGDPEEAAAKIVGLEDEIERLQRVHEEWFNGPNGVKWYMAENERLRSQLAQWERQTQGQVWISNEEYAALCALKRIADETAPQSSNERDETLNAWLRDCDPVIESGVATEMICVCPVALRRFVRELLRLRAAVETDARRTAEYWKAEHIAGNKEIDRLTEVLRRIGNPEFVYSSDDDDEDQLSLRMADARASVKSAVAPSSWKRCGHGQANPNNCPECTPANGDEQ